jgi:hypothetical protein
MWWVLGQSQVADTCLITQKIGWACDHVAYEQVLSPRSGTNVAINSASSFVVQQNSPLLLLTISIVFVSSNRCKGLIFLPTSTFLTTFLIYPSHQAHYYQVNAIERQMQTFATLAFQKNCSAIWPPILL